MLKKHSCIECNGEFTSRQYNADFCSGACRKTFNNRRLTRGAVLYDFTMLIASAEPGPRGALERRRDKIIARWRQEDHAAKRRRMTKRLSDVMTDTAAYEAEVY